MANFLTLARIVLIVPFALCFAIDATWGAWAALVLFLIAAATDFFDGRIARARGETSALGAALDPVADKALAAAAIVLLAASGTIADAMLAPAIAIIVREVLVAGLREALAGRATLPVSPLAKVKTFAELGALAALLTARAGAPPVALSVGDGLLWASAALALWTGWDYARVAAVHLRRT